MASSSWPTSSFLPRKRTAAVVAGGCCRRLFLVVTVLMVADANSIVSGFGVVAAATSSSYVATRGTAQRAVAAAFLGTARPSTTRRRGRIVAELQPRCGRQRGYRCTSPFFSSQLLASSPRTAAEDEQRKTKRLEGCVCLVTGSSRGIGKGIALELGREGATVYVTGTSTTSAASTSSKEKKKDGAAAAADAEEQGGPYMTSPDVGGPGTVEETAEEINNAGGVGVAVRCNHAVDSDVQELMDAIEKEHGHLDILVNNCFRLPRGGVEKLYGKFWEQGVDVWDAIHSVGLRSHYVATCMAMPLLLKSPTLQKNNKNKNNSLPRPFVAMVSSFGGLTYTFNVPYGVGKAGVDRLAKDMAVELTPENISVVSFWPGVVATERTNIAVETGNWDKYVGIPLENAESPEFTGRAVVNVALDPNNLEQKSGTYQVVAELAGEYGFTDVNGKRPPSIRSLKFLLPSYAFDESLRDKIPSWLIPDWKLPFWVMAQGKPPKPDE